MDGRLSEAAQAGDVDYLLHLIKNQPLILRAVALAGGESPLHIASMAGHLDFVREILKYRKEFAAELNPDGFSSLHIASAIGETEIVKELLSVDQNLCLIKGKESRISLHYASINGRVEIIKELLSACPDSIEESTARGETSLHLAVKYHQFEAFKVLSDHITKFKKEGALNKKDSQGNTILHLAVMKKQYEVIDFMLRGNVLTHGSLEVNSLDERGLTPLDVLLLVQNEVGDKKIEEILRQAGALQNQLIITSNSPGSGQPSLDNNQLPSTKFQYKESRDSPSEIRNCLLVIAVLIATATYIVVLSPPGGVWQDTYKPSNNSSSTKGTTSTKHSAGTSVVGTYHRTPYIVFLYFNSVGFYVSLYIIFFLTKGFPLQFELRLAILAIIITYDACMGATAPDNTSFTFSMISTVMPLGIAVLITVMRDYLGIIK